MSLVLDRGAPLVVACDPDGYGWDHVYTGLAVGERTSVTMTFTTTDRLGRVSDPMSVTYVTRLR